MRALITLLATVALLSVGCGSNDGQDAAAAPTAAPVQTALPEPTATDTPQVQPEPERVLCAAAPGPSSYQLDAGGAAHDVQIFVPSTAVVADVLPVVLNWHGLGSNGPQQALFTDYEAIAEQEGFVVVHPTGVPVPGDERNSWELIQFDAPDRDDVAFAEALIDDVIARFCGDPERIYSTGMSNGGLFTSRLICDLADRIAAASSVAGLTHPDGCAPSRPVPFIAFHGTADAVVPFDGTTTESSLAEPSVPGSTAFFAQVMPDEFAEFAADMGCDLTPAVGAVGDDVTRYDYQGCDDGVPLTFFEVAEGGHTWPGSPFADVAVAQLGYTTTTVSATADSWAFFEQHALPVASEAS